MLKTALSQGFLKLTKLKKSYANISATINSCKESLIRYKLYVMDGLAII